MASIRKAAASTLRTATRPTISRSAPALVRFNTTTVPTTPHDLQAPLPLAGIVRNVGPQPAVPTEAMQRDNPDYQVIVDYRTSHFSPLPSRVMDGSEPGPDVPAAVLSGAPPELQARTVRIYRPTKSATQSGDWGSHHWRMDWDPLQKGHRWENPLTGWQSSADFMQGTHLNFQTKEAAVTFANKQGYEFFVQEPNERKFVPKAYADQFVWQAKPLKKIPTK